MNKLRTSCRLPLYLLLVISVEFAPNVFAEAPLNIQNDIQAMKAEIAKLQKQVIELTQRQLGTQQCAATKQLDSSEATGASKSVPETLQVQQPSQNQNSSQTLASAFNPAMGLMLDNVLSAQQKDRTDFEFRSAEILLSANVDPFLKGYGVFVGSEDEFEVEEAALQTTSLPYNLTLKGGRFFADFGRLAKFHDHDLPVVNRPIALDKFLDGEPKAEGAELSYLLPSEQYLNFVFGIYDSIGAENQRLDRSSGRALSEMTYLGKAATFIGLSDAHSLDLSASLAYTPQVAQAENSARVLSGLELTYRYVPLESGSYQGLIWGTEIFQNHEARTFPSDESLLGGGQDQVYSKKDAYGLYSYLETKISRRYVPGFLFDYSQDLDRVNPSSKRYSPYLTIWLSEFQRLRLQYSYLQEDDENKNQFFLQWTAALGDHKHGFKDR